MVHYTRCSVIRQQVAEAKWKEEKTRLPHPLAALSDRPLSATLPGQSLLCCPVTGAHDLQRHKNKFSSRDSRGQQPTNSQTHKVNLVGQNKYWEIRKVAWSETKAGKTQKTNEATLCLAEQIRHASHIPSHCNLQCPTERAPRPSTCNQFLLSLLPVTGPVLILHFPLLPASLPSKRDFLNAP